MHTFCCHYIIWFYDFKLWTSKPNLFAVQGQVWGEYLESIVESFKSERKHPGGLHSILGAALHPDLQ